MTSECCDFCSPKPATDTCAKCGKTEAGIAWFAEAFRKLRAKRGQSDPGNLCGGCAGSMSGKEIGEKIFGAKA